MCVFNKLLRYIAPVRNHFHAHKHTHVQTHSESKSGDCRLTRQPWQTLSHTCAHANTHTHTHTHKYVIVAVSFWARLADGAHTPAHMFAPCHITHSRYDSQRSLGSSITRKDLVHTCHCVCVCVCVHLWVYVCVCTCVCVVAKQRWDFL